jgi:hypothetical protein
MKKKEHFITEIKDGKATTYVDCTSSIMNNVFNMSTDSSNPLKKSNFMTDRSATKNKANAYFINYFNITLHNKK